MLINYVIKVKFPVASFVYSSQKIEDYHPEIWDSCITDRSSNYCMSKSIIYWSILQYVQSQIKKKKCKMNWNCLFSYTLCGCSLWMWNSLPNFSCWFLLVKKNHRTCLFGVNLAFLVLLISVNCAGYVWGFFSIADKIAFIVISASWRK